MCAMRVANNICINLCTSSKHVIRMRLCVFSRTTKHQSSLPLQRPRQTAICYGWQPQSLVRTTRVFTRVCALEYVLTSCLNEHAHNIGAVRVPSVIDIVLVAHFTSHRAGDVSLLHRCGLSLIGCGCNVAACNIRRISRDEHAVETLWLIVVS